MVLRRASAVVVSEGLDLAARCVVDAAGPGHIGIALASGARSRDFECAAPGRVVGPDPGAVRSRGLDGATQAVIGGAGDSADGIDRGDRLAQAVVLNGRGDVLAGVGGPARNVVGDLAHGPTVEVVPGERVDATSIGDGEGVARQVERGDCIAVANRRVG